MDDSNSRETLRQFDNGDEVGWCRQVLTYSAKGGFFLFIWLSTFWSRVHLDICGCDVGVLLLGVGRANVTTREVTLLVGNTLGELLVEPERYMSFWSSMGWFDDTHSAAVSS
jgi:hypothetical protein